MKLRLGVCSAATLISRPCGRRSMRRDWFAIATARNSEGTISETLISVLHQDCPPTLVVVVDDGSSDSTPKKLAEMQDRFAQLKVITNEDEGYDIRRIVHNWNKALQLADELGGADYHFITADDCLFPQNYVGFLLDRFDEDSKLVVASGTRGLRIRAAEENLPEGAGRLVQQSFFNAVGGRYPPKYGYESWVLYKALQQVYHVNKFLDLRYSHSRKFGSQHRFVEYGAMMRCLGYYPPYALARSVRNILRGSGEFPLGASVRMLIDYLFADYVYRGDPYYVNYDQYYDRGFRGFVSSLQKRKLLRALGLSKK